MKRWCLEVCGVEKEEFGGGFIHSRVKIRTMDLAVKQLISTLEYKHSKYNDPSILLLFDACITL